MHAKRLLYMKKNISTKDLLEKKARVNKLGARSW